jgi:hypothetical protein
MDAAAAVLEIDAIKQLKARYFTDDVINPMFSVRISDGMWRAGAKWARRLSK